MWSWGGEGEGGGGEGGGGRGGGGIFLFKKKSVKRCYQFFYLGNFFLSIFFIFFAIRYTLKSVAL